MGHLHILENLQSSFFKPELLNNASIEQWQGGGTVEVNERALAYAKIHLGEHQDPALDPGLDEALRDCIARPERNTPAAYALNQTL